MTVEYIWTEVRRPRRDDPTDAGVIEEGWFIVEHMWVILTDRDGNRLSGDGNKRKLEPGDNPRAVAVGLLRRKVRSRPAKSFNRPLRYPRLVY
jgi:hypothetical protein